MPPLPICLLLFMACLPVKLNHAGDNTYSNWGVHIQSSHRGLNGTNTYQPEPCPKDKVRLAQWSRSPAYDYAIGSYQTGGPHAFANMNGHGGGHGAAQSVSH